ncbi:TPA: hypothetical protein ROY17_005926, partial [Bacillus thuringiensis]|nr:hypothetical protein [Bacillus thuringiensis]
TYVTFGDERLLGVYDSGSVAGITTVLPNLKKNTKYKLVITAKKQNPDVTQGIRVELANKRLQDIGLTLSARDAKRLEVPFTTGDDPTGDNARINILLSDASTQLIISSVELFEIKGSSTNQPEAPSTSQPGGFTGWVDLPYIDKDHDKYGYKENGEFVTGLKQIDKDWYYFDTNHAKAFGWKEIDGKKYYFDPVYEGTMTRGETITIKGKSYTFDNNGVCTNP